MMNIRSFYDSFRDLRENHAYYIDKTAFLEDYLVKRFNKAVLFARSRRFGKTLTMFRDFLDIRQKSEGGFTDGDVKTLLKDAGASEGFERLLAGGVELF